MTLLESAILRSRTCKPLPVPKKPITVWSEVSAGPLGKFEVTIPTPAPALQRFLRVRAIKKAICERYGFSHEELIGAQRRKALIVPRHIAIYLCTKMTTFSLPQLGKLFGDRDHSSIWFARNKIAEGIITDPALGETVAEIEAQIISAEWGNP